MAKILSGVKISLWCLFLFVYNSSIAQRKPTKVPIIIKDTLSFYYARTTDGWFQIPNCHGLYYRIFIWPFVMEQSNPIYGNCGTNTSRIEIQNRNNKDVEFKLRFQVESPSCDGPEKPLTAVNTEVVFDNRQVYGKELGKKEMIARERYFYRFLDIKVDYFRIIKDSNIKVTWNTDITGPHNENVVDGVWPEQVFPGSDSSTLIEDQQKEVNSYINERKSIVESIDCNYQGEQLQTLQQFQAAMDANFKKFYEDRLSGKKIISCPHCMGRGTRYCENCLETFGKTCATCNGTHSIKCPTCHGLGCSACNNMGSIQCYDCRGCGTFFGKEYECDHIGLSSCSWCNGTGLTTQ